MKKGDRQVGNEWIYLGVLQRIGFDQLSWKDDGLRWRGTARQRIPAVSTANAMVETVCFWLLQRVGVRPDFALPLYWNGCCFEYLEWAGAAPCSEPGQVREEAAISRYFYVGVVFHREIRIHIIFYIKDVKIWGTQLFIESSDHKHFQKW